MNSRVANAMLRELMEIKLAALRPDIITSTLEAAAKKAKPPKGPSLRPELYSHITDRPRRAAQLPTELVGSVGAHPAMGGGGGAALVP